MAASGAAVSTCFRAIQNRPSTSATTIATPSPLPDPRLQIMAPPFRLVLYETDRETRRIPSRKGSEFVSRRATSDSRVDHLGALGRLVTSTWSSRFRPRLPHARSTIGGPRPGMRKGTHTSPACTAFLALSAAASIALRCFSITMPETSDARRSAAPAHVAATAHTAIDKQPRGGRVKTTNGFLLKSLPSAAHVSAVIVTTENELGA